MQNEVQTNERVAVGWATAARRPGKSSFCILHSAFCLSSAAFTLIELILVLAILSIVVVIVGPQLRGFTLGRTTSNEASALLAMTHYARTQAAAQGHTYRLNYDPQGRALWLTFENGGAFASPGNDFGEKLTIADGVTIDTDIAKQEDGQYVEFHPNGRTDPAKISLSDTFGTTIVIACSSATELFRILPAAEVGQ